MYTGDWIFSIVMSVLMILGYILYIIPISPVFPVFGITLQGVSVVLNAIINSEILRIYNNDKIPGKLLMILISYGFGETIGPIIAKLLDKVDFWVGSLHTMPCLVLITYINNKDYIHFCGWRIEAIWLKGKRGPSRVDWNIGDYNSYVLVAQV